MNKVLLATTAISLSFAGFASAQIDANWSGSYTYGISSVSSDGDTDAMSIQQGSDMEIDFKGKFEMDNGLTTSVDMEIDFEDANDTPEFDDIELTVGGSFGTIGFGKFDYTDTGASYVPLPAVDATSTKIEEAVADFTNMSAGDGDGIYYATPKLSFGDFGIGAIAGYHAGRTLAAASEGNSGVTTTQNDAEEQVSMGLNVDGSFGDASVELGLAHTLRLDNDDETETTIGLAVGFGEFSVTAAYETHTSANSLDTDTMGISGSYSTGPWGLTAGYTVQDIEGATSAEDDETTSVLGRITYAVGPGMTLGLQGLQSEEDRSGDSGSEIKLYTTIGF